MASILSIDTSGTCCSVALAINSRQLVKRTDTPREHVRLVLPMVDELLAEADIKLSTLDALAFTHGPGSFTGLRIGLGVVQGLAFGADLPVIALSSLQLMAQRAIRLHSLASDSIIIPAIDARMGELYWGIYSQCNGFARALAPDALCPQQEMDLPLLDELKNGGPLIGVGDGWQYQPELRSGEKVLKLNVTFQAIGPDAEDILSLAAVALQNGQVSAIEDVQPLYLRNTISWKKRQRLRSLGSAG
ncbi:MAG: tRNA (adenosine(37)-N6)-threonylcarbamoyltransferase complex dimerization subunit type 1 TsaB [Gammaproteobacteria bacterium]|nr:tRNA (adenosine(37)-N6)-threonylcarbamoyltransferase complex dimerization subunit type 1 TsaB [Gammaproteobacteria bacterium]MBQ0839790.1 tRNA (adenosine(37)-N6)-threonylcarbamoyltransferase complex dimerization subunit type 1 TsaB [Gammaproteobacteria bacterium]